jgi:glycosyltransferase involved in cell wall biosynthesis
VRDSMLRNADRPVERLAARAKEKTQETIARLIARYADATVVVADSYKDELGSFSPRGPISVVPNGADFDDFAGIDYRPNGRFRVTHTGAMFGKRDPRPFLTAFARADLEHSVARFVGDFRQADREWVDSLGLGERLEIHPYVPRRESLAFQRDSEALLLLMPEVPGRGSGVIAAKVFEYLAAERPIIAAVPPDGAAAKLVREAGAGIVVPPEDVAGIREALVGLEARWRAGRLDGTPLEPALRERISRRKRVEELSELLQEVT